MNPEEKAIIFLAEQRGCTQTPWYRSYHTFNFGSYYQEHRKPSGSLRVLNDNTLKEGHQVKHEIQDDTLILLLPIVGSCQYQYGPDKSGTVEVGQCLNFYARQGLEMEISNPFKSEPINYFYAELVAKNDLLGGSTLNGFDLDTNKNTLVNNLSEQTNAVLIGKFDGRSDGVYKPLATSNQVFIFIIEGAFEVQNRLLHARDGLALWNMCEIEFEALSNEAIILIIESAPSI